jgi:GT2 family glycosyltransferase
MNSQRHRLFTSRRERAAARRAGAFPIRTASFVSVLVDGHAAWKHRLPRADYFIWNDDLEYTARLLRHAQGIAVPSSVTVHHTKAFAGSFQDPGERFYYEVRNKLWTFFQSPAFGPLDNTIYLLYTVLGWGRAIVRSKNRGILWRGLCRGLRHGLFRRPRPNPQVLAGQGQVSAEVLAIERRAARL